MTPWRFDDDQGVPVARMTCSPGKEAKDFLLSKGASSYNRPLRKSRVS